MKKEKKNVLKVFLLAAVLGVASFLGYKTEKIINKSANSEKKEEKKEFSVSKEKNNIAEKEVDCDYESVGCNGFF